MPQVTLYAGSDSYRVNYNEDGTEFRVEDDEWAALPHQLNDDKRLFKFQLPNKSTLELLARAKNVKFQNAIKKALELSSRRGLNVTPSSGSAKNKPELDDMDDDVENHPQARSSIGNTKKMRETTSTTVPARLSSLTSIDKENSLGNEKTRLASEQPVSVSLIRSLGDLTPVGLAAWTLTKDAIDENTFCATCSTESMRISFRFSPVRRYDSILLTDLQYSRVEERVKVLFHLTKDCLEFTDDFDAHTPFGDEIGELQTYISTGTDGSFIEKILAMMKSSQSSPSAGSKNARPVHLTKHGQVHYDTNEDDYESIKLNRNSNKKIFTSGDPVPSRNGSITLTRKDSESSSAGKRCSSHVGKHDRVDLFPSTAYRVLIDAFIEVSSEPRKVIIKRLTDIVKSAWFRRELQFGYCMVMAGRESISTAEKLVSNIMNTWLQKDSNYNQINFEDLIVVNKPFEGREFWRVQAFEDQIMLIDPDSGETTNSTWIKPTHFGFVYMFHFNSYTKRTNV
jgi:hypothetical protein